MKCPICENQLEEIDVAPCYDCGHAEGELKELKENYHEYHVFKVFGQEIVLCDFCDADFGSYYPDYFGLPGEYPQDYPMELLHKLEKPEIEKDLYCSECKHRKDFLEFLENARKANRT